MKSTLIVLGSVAAALLGTPLATSAAISKGTYRTESNLPLYRSGTPLVYEVRAASSAGDELTSGDFVSNPDGWGGGVVVMDLNAATGVLTLKSQDTWDFQTFNASIFNIRFSTPGESICGITYLGGSITNEGIVPSVVFSDNGIGIVYTANVVAGSVFNFNAGTASFQINTCVPAFTGARKAAESNASP